VSDDEFADMPGLQSVSDSSEDGSNYDSDSDESDGYSTADESEYDEEAEDEIRDLLREAMDTLHEGDYDNYTAESRPNPAVDPFREDYTKGNPFLKLLGSLRGLSNIFEACKI